MPPLNPSHERERLAEVYAGKTNEELQELAESAYSLTESARSVLSEEVQRRNLEFELKAAPILEKNPDLVILRRYRDLPSALVAKSVLDSANIECFLTDQNTIRMDWFLSNALGGVKLWIKREDAEAAAELLRQQLSESFDAEGAGKFATPQCPRCHSANISFQELNKPAPVATVAAEIPMHVLWNQWRCHACEHEWFDAAD